MPSKGVRHRHTKRKTARNAGLLGRTIHYQAAPAGPAVELECSTCGYTAKSARGLKVHKGRMKHD